MPELSSSGQLRPLLRNRLTSPKSPIGAGIRLAKRKRRSIGPRFARRTKAAHMASDNFRVQSHDVIRSVGIATVMAVSVISVSAHTAFPGPAQQASSPTDRHDNEMTITGCLYLGPHGDYLLTTAEIKAVEPGLPAGAVGTSGSAVVPFSGTTMTVTGWKLEQKPDLNDGLLPYLLQMIEITGQPATAGSATLGAVGTSGVVGTAAADKPPQGWFKVKSIKRISMTVCSESRSR